MRDIIDLQTDQIESYTDPAEGSYGVMRRYTLNESVAPAEFPNLQLAVAQIIPGRRHD